MPQDHPERRPNEIYMGTTIPASFLTYNWKTKRLGETPCPVGTQTKPWFVSRAEMEERAESDAVHAHTYQQMLRAQDGLDAVRANPVLDAIRAEKLLMEFTFHQELGRPAKMQDVEAYLAAHADQPDIGERLLADLRELQAVPY